MCRSSSSAEDQQTCHLLSSLSWKRGVYPTRRAPISPEMSQFPSFFTAILSAEKAEVLLPRAPAFHQLALGLVMRRVAESSLRGRALESSWKARGGLTDQGSACARGHDGWGQAFNRSLWPTGYRRWTDPRSAAMDRAITHGLINALVRNPLCSTQERLGHGDIP